MRIIDLKKPKTGYVYTDGKGFKVRWHNAICEYFTRYQFFRMTKKSSVILQVNNETPET